MSSIATADHPIRAPFLARYNASPIQAIALAAVALFLIAFLVVPLARVIVVAFTGPDGGFSLVHFGDFFRTSLLRDAFWNSIYVAAMTVVVASLIAVPLATILARFRFRGAALIHTLGVVPLVMPPFVGAVAMQLIFGRNGSINLLLNDWFGFRIPFMEGLNGVIFVEALHYFPFILLNLSASLGNIDSAMEESAQNLGARGFTLVLAHRVPARHAGLRRRRGAGVRQGVRRSRDAASAQRHLHAGAAGVSQDHHGRPRRSDGLRHLGHHDHLLARRHAALGTGAARPRFRHHAARRRRAVAATARPRRQRARRGFHRRHADARAVAAHRHIPALDRHRMVVRGAARRLHVRALRARSTAKPRR